MEVIVIAKKERIPVIKSQQPLKIPVDCLLYCIPLPLTSMTTLSGRFELMARNRSCAWQYLAVFL